MDDDEFDEQDDDFEFGGPTSAQQRQTESTAQRRGKRDREFAEDRRGGSFRGGKGTVRGGGRRNGEGQGQR